MRVPIWKGNVHPVARLSAIVAIVAAVVGFAPTSAQAQSPAYGRTADDLAMEEFLRTAEIVAIEEVGDGITHPRRVTLGAGDRQLRAIFKTVDIELEDATHGDSFEHHFTDKYTYEAAAYRLDRLIGIGLVPVTVIRTIDGEKGSLQHWIEGVITLEDALKETQTEIRNFDLLVQRLALTYVLDALIYNIDRNHSNFVVDVEKDIFHPIDHSRAFRLNGKPPPLNLETRTPLPRTVAEPLQSFDLKTLKAVLGEFLEENQIRAVVKRRDRLVKMLDRAGLLAETAAG